MQDTEMPVSKKQLLRLLRFIDLLKSNSFPNCASFAEMMQKADWEENLNITCSAKTIYRDIKTLKNDFKAPIKFDFSRNGYFLTDLSWDFFAGGKIKKKPDDCGMIFPNVTFLCDHNSVNFFRDHPLALQQKIIALPDRQYKVLAKGRISYFTVISSLMQCNGKAAVMYPAILKEKIRKTAYLIWENHLN